MLGMKSCLDNQKSTRRFKTGVKPSAVRGIPSYVTYVYFSEVNLAKYKEIESMDKLEHAAANKSQEEYEAERKLIEFYRGLTDEQKRTFNELIDTFNSLLVQNQE